MKRGRNPEPLDGVRFGKLVVVRCLGSDKWNKRIFLCKCDCGNEKIVSSALLSRGECVSCGCVQKEMRERKKTRNGLTAKRIYNVWYCMKQRCYNENFKQYKDYGGRGITICDEWRGKKGLQNFAKWAYENGYDENAPRGKCTIDRINNNGNYEPSNCRWVDMKTQSKNKRH